MKVLFRFLIIPAGICTFQPNRIKYMYVYINKETRGLSKTISNYIVMQTTIAFKVQIEMDIT